MYKLVRVRRKPKTRSSNKTVLRSVIFLPNSWQEKRVYVIEAHEFNKILVGINKLKRKIAKVAQILK